MTTVTRTVALIAILAGVGAGAAHAQEPPATRQPPPPLPSAFKPDLAVSKVDTTHVVVTNRGLSPARRFVIYVYQGLCGGSIEDIARVEGPVSYLVRRLAPGANVVVTLPPSMGQRPVWVDYGKSIDERDESNNTATVPRVGWVSCADAARRAPDTRLLPPAQSKR